MDDIQFQKFRDEEQSSEGNLDFNVIIEEKNNTGQSTSQVAPPVQAPVAEPEQKQTVQIPISALPDYSKTAKKSAESSYLSQAAHPSMCILTMAFKIISIGTFLSTVFILDWIFSSKIIPFILIIISAAFDFWVVKNLTGRYLVKLRWWSEIQEDGQEKWSFESFEDGIPPNRVDSTFFWMSQVIPLIFWAITALLNFLSLSIFYFTLSFANLILIGGNFVGYYKCRGAHQQKMKNAVSKLGLKMLSDAL